MAVGSSELGILHPVPGIRMSAVSAGIKKPGRLDVVVFELAEGSTSAGIFTTNAFCAAPVIISMRHLITIEPRYLLINTGNANAGTGEPGLNAAMRCCEALAHEAKVQNVEVLPFSTGVIGEPLPADKICAVLRQSLRELKDNDWEKAARGIMTTDTRPKAASARVAVGSGEITVTGIAKGAGMIKPNMATMLAYVFTDIGMDEEQAKAQLKAAADLSFNRITVDGDTSTNDACMLVATGKSGVQYQELPEQEQEQFSAALQGVFIELAQAIIRDAEGASKFVTVNVEGGKNDAECLAVAYAIAESPLVKTALFASDPNWGRILAVVGRVGLVDLILDRVQIFLDDICIVENGARAASYSEELGRRVFAGDSFAITVKLDRGRSRQTVWTCDLSYDYVKINAEYRT